MGVLIRQCSNSLPRRFLLRVRHRCLMKEKPPHTRSNTGKAAKIVFEFEFGRTPEISRAIQAGNFKVQKKVQGSSLEMFIWGNLKVESERGLCTVGTYIHGV